MPSPVSRAFTLALAVGLLAGCHKGAASKTPTPATVTPISVETRAAAREAIGHVAIVNGSIIPRAQVAVLPKTSGRVTELRVTEGDRVRRGQVLAVLDTPELGWQLRQSRTGLLTAQANLDQAADNYRRMKELADEGVISQQQLKSAETQLRLATSQLDQTKASIALMETQLANGTLTSPIDGVVIAKGLDLGAMAGPTTAVVTLAQAGALQVKLPVAERDLPMIRVGSRVAVTSVALPGQTFEARIVEVAPMVDPQTRLITVKADLVGANELKVGMNVSTAISGPTHEAVCVPQDAVLTDGAEQIVYLAEGSKAVRTRVATGLRDDRRVEITQGLKGGEPLIVKGASFVKDGDPIRVNGEKL